MTLSELGFLPDEIYTCRIWRDTRFAVPVRVEGEDAVMTYAPGVRLDIALDGANVHARGFPIERQAEGFGACRLGAFEALGRTRPHETAVFHGGPGPESRSTHAGWIGSAFFADAIVAADAAAPALGVSARPEIREGFTGAAVRLALLPDVPDGLPLTCAVRDVRADRHPVLLVAAEHAFSSLSLPYIDDHWRDAQMRRRANRIAGREKPIDVRIELPGGLTLTLPLCVDREPPMYAVDPGVERIDGILGVDLLRRWIHVLDYPGRELLLFEY